MEITFESLKCQRGRRKRYTSGQKRLGQIFGRRPISERLSHIEEFRQIGHWEGDTIIGKRHKHAIVSLAEHKSGCGHRRVHIMLKREGRNIGRNLVYRHYREEGLVLRTKRPRRRKMGVHREARIQPKRPKEVWSLDFIHDVLSNGQKFRALTVVDIFTREGLANRSRASITRRECC